MNRVSSLVRLIRIGILSLAHSELIRTPSRELERPYLHPEPEPDLRPASDEYETVLLLLESTRINLHTGHTVRSTHVWGCDDFRYHVITFYENKSE